MAGACRRFLGSNRCEPLKSDTVKTSIPGGLHDAQPPFTGDRVPGSPSPDGRFPFRKVPGKRGGAGPEINDIGNGLRRHVGDDTSCVGQRQHILCRDFRRSPGTIPAMMIDTKDDARERGNRLRKARKAAGYTSADGFAEAHGFATSTVRSAENGSRPLTIRNAKQYAKYLGVSWQKLYFGSDEHPEAIYAEVVENLKAIHPRRREIILDMIRTEAELESETSDGKIPRE